VTVEDPHWFKGIKLMDVIGAWDLLAGEKPKIDKPRREIL